MYVTIPFVQVLRQPTPAKERWCSFPNELPLSASSSSISWIRAIGDNPIHGVQHSVHSISLFACSSFSSFLLYFSLLCKSSQLQRQSKSRPTLCPAVALPYDSSSVFRGITPARALFRPNILSEATKKAITGTHNAIQSKFPKHLSSTRPICLGPAQMPHKCKVNLRLRSCYNRRYNFFPILTERLHQCNRQFPCAPVRPVHRDRRAGRTQGHAIRSHGCRKQHTAPPVSRQRFFSERCRATIARHGDAPLRVEKWRMSK